MLSAITQSEANLYARREHRDYEVYRVLAEIEKDLEFRTILQKLMEQERTDYEFWSRFASEKTFIVGRWTLLCYVVMRKVLGLVFTAKLLERREREIVKTYSAILKRMNVHLKSDFESILAHEREHEQAFISSIKEDRLNFTGNIVLGLNDGLIELTGALVGFSFALSDMKFVALTGLITGVSATLSMASSAYMQAKYSEEKEPFRAAMYTGGAYLTVVVLLVTPFLISTSNVVALSFMGIFALTIIALITGFWSVIFDRSFWREFLQMASITIGVSCITFILGLIFRSLFGVSL